MSGDTRYAKHFRFSIFDFRFAATSKSAIGNRQSAIASGFLLTELIVAMSVVGLLLAGLMFSLNGFAKFNRYQLVRQQCIAAAQAQLDSISATGRPIAAEELSRLWPGLSVAVKQIPGEGQWDGTQRVEVTASGKSYRKNIEIRLSRYIRNL